MLSIQKFRVVFIIPCKVACFILLLLLIMNNFWDKGQRILYMDGFDLNTVPFFMWRVMNKNKKKKAEMKFFYEGLSESYRVGCYEFRTTYMTKLENDSWREKRQSVTTESKLI